MCGQFTVMTVCELLTPPGPLTVNVTVNEPCELNVYEGLASLLVPPSPKLHEYDVIFPDD